MCSIVMSVDTDEMIKLVRAGSVRGSASHSISMISDQGLVSVTGHYEKLLHPEVLEVEPRSAMLIHQLASTGSLSQLHPACNIVPGTQSFLWHNGLIKTEEIKRLQTSLNIHTEWDTELLLHAIIDNSGIPPMIEGSFACIMLHKKEVFAFRNELAPLYAGEKSIASTPFEGATEIEAGWMYRVRISPTNLLLEKRGPFPLQHNPYFVEGELNKPIWATITIDTILALDVTYAEAARVLNENITAPGALILSADAARKMEVKKKHGDN